VRLSVRLMGSHFCATISHRATDHFLLVRLCGATRFFESDTSPRKSYLYKTNILSEERKWVYIRQICSTKSTVRNFALSSRPTSRVIWTINCYPKTTREAAYIGNTEIAPELWRNLASFKNCKIHICNWYRWGVPSEIPGVGSLLWWEERTPWEGGLYSYSHSSYFNIASSTPLTATLGTVKRAGNSIPV
jgi:hypothetical protein